MLKQILAFVFLLASVSTVYCGDALQKTHTDNSTFQHQSKRNAGSTQYHMPYSGDIRHPVFDGKEIYIEGDILERPHRFTVDLCETKTCFNDIEMQADYRFATQVFSMNYRRNLHWGTASEYSGNHLEVGKKLKMTVLIESQQFKILVNSKTFVMKADVRVPKLKYIRIRGTANIDWILYSVRDIF
ncbi:uncharacterized protein LOC131929926 [Physella acuta]|uniref:uncharacterized protein LOC131929926 n=1 Tax=Physella acuta TaxID=109671 RepID=UPI0027DAE8DC|nr:uncharacterized protein LOC131929926 [Physella acuta]